MLFINTFFTYPGFCMGGGPESRCVGRVYGADGAVFLYFAIRLIGFASENLLEEVSVVMLLYLEVSSEFCCKTIDMFVLDSPIAGF